jgi:hypothetical protein
VITTACARRVQVLYHKNQAGLNVRAGDEVVVLDRQRHPVTVKVIQIARQGPEATQR